MGRLSERPLWERFYHWWQGDFLFYYGQREYFLGMARKYPGESMWLEVIRGLDNMIKIQNSAYKKLYGESFKMINTEAVAIVEYILSSGYKLNSWEEGFISSVLTQSYKLTTPQRECLNRMVAKCSN